MSQCKGRGGVLYPWLQEPTENSSALPEGPATDPEMGDHAGTPAVHRQTLYAVLPGLGGICTSAMPRDKYKAQLRRKRTSRDGVGGGVPLELGREKMRKENICFSISSTEVEKN